MNLSILEKRRKRTTKDVYRTFNQNSFEKIQTCDFHINRRHFSRLNWMRTKKKQKAKTNHPGLEPGIFNFEGWRLIHLASDPFSPFNFLIYDILNHFLFVVFSFFLPCSIISFFFLTISFCFPLIFYSLSLW